jgi:hypothetical protein
MACGLCRQTKTIHDCSECKKSLCKDCVRYLEKEEFRFHPKAPKIFQQRQFCVDCYAELIEPEMAKYKEAFDRSYQITLIRKSFRGFVPILQKAKAPLLVKDHVDKGDAIAHLCFLTAWYGYDAMMDVEAVAKKIRNHAWEKKEWSASALPVKLDRKRFRPESLENF